MNPARPELNGQQEVKLRCLDVIGVVEYDARGIPVVFRRRCKNRECCEPRDGFVAVHRWTIHGRQNNKGVSEYTTDYVPLRPVSDLIEHVNGMHLKNQ
jgi:hypothetical protein